MNVQIAQNTMTDKKYPFNEGDDYWYECDGMILYGGCWDDISEELHDQNPNREYFSDDEVLDVARANGIKYKCCMQRIDQQLVYPCLKKMKDNE